MVTDDTCDYFPIVPDVELDDVEAVKRQRQVVYGDPYENHRGIAQAWAGLLQPHAAAIARGEPVPAWTVALMMAAVKLNRMRRVYHADNYTDVQAYLDFAADWQRKESPCTASTSPVPTPPPPSRSA